MFSKSPFVLPLNGRLPSTASSVSTSPNPERESKRIILVPAPRCTRRCTAVPPAHDSGYRRRISEAAQKKTPNTKMSASAAVPKEIHRKCIDLRILFWSRSCFKDKPLARIPRGDNNWSITQSGRENNKRNRVSYLNRYGAI